MNGFDVKSMWLQWLSAYLSAVWIPTDYRRFRRNRRKSNKKNQDNWM